MNIEIEQLLPDSTGPRFDSALALHHSIVNERDPAVDPDSEAMFRAELKSSDTFVGKVFVAYDGDEAVGLGITEWANLASNVDKGEIEIEVSRNHRRRGIGTALLDKLLNVCEEDGRRSVATFNLNSEEARGFWAALGAEQKMIDRESRLWVADTDEALMRDWVKRREARAGDYRLEQFRGPTPSHLLSAHARMNVIMNDAPRDDLDWDDDVWTEDDIIELDELHLGRGRERWVTMAFSPEGEPAGYTTVFRHPDKPRFAYQGNTAVDPSHRNRGLGRWLKGDMFLRLRADAPEVVAIDTDNAESNDAMLAINIEMGFKPLLEWGIWQADTSTLRAGCRAKLSTSS